MLRVDLRAVEDGPVEVSGVIEPGDPVLEGTDVVLGEPIRIQGRITAAGLGRYYWRGHLTTTVVSECRRCLREVRTRLDEPTELMFVTEDEAAHDPVAYPIPEGTEILDLREPIREELVLDAPNFPLCREDCAGLCDQCGTDLNTGTCDCRPTPDPRWAALDALKGTLPGSEEN